MTEPRLNVPTWHGSLLVLDRWRETTPCLAQLPLTPPPVHLALSASAKSINSWTTAWHWHGWHCWQGAVRGRGVKLLSYPACALSTGCRFRFISHCTQRGMGTVGNGWILRGTGRERFSIWLQLAGTGREWIYLNRTGRDWLWFSFPCPSLPQKGRALTTFYAEIFIFFTPELRGCGQQQTTNICVQSQILTAVCWHLQSRWRHSPDLWIIQPGLAHPQFRRRIFLLPAHFPAKIPGLARFADFTPFSEIKSSRRGY